ncbi:glycosyl transferase, WecB/TagA/CpsF family [Pseudarthrobacter chlorophenolicus A6]|uniref:Glycosyl transferase, WecB/TagA/CpsF family n=2 Tax=Pseudarthrobacter chlorophenolicus TaxID=85085 RepID=B8H8W5_PSECP|nr:glycosyl transferase, WecB/TagA/CpsF family [Pseudarthrobacter chlorophenolicus A6]
MTMSSSLRALVQPAAWLDGTTSRHPAGDVNAKSGAPLQLSADNAWVTLGGSPVRLLDFEEAVELIMQRSRPGRTPLAVASANLDHLQHFGAGARWAGILERQDTPEWLSLLDGAPLVRHVQGMTGRTWPRLSGSDLIGPILDRAELAGIRVGFLGGSEEVHTQVRSRLATSHPRLVISGFWSPARSELADHVASSSLATRIAATDTDILVVCLGKPRQELWIAEYGYQTGANVMLAFGAAVDFLGGRVRRAPAVAQNVGMEWAWRLALEPRRLANRYLVQGPEAYLRLLSVSSFGRESFAPRQQPQDYASKDLTDEGFSPLTSETDVAVIIVTYNNERDIPLLLKSLQGESREQSIKVIVADNSPGPSTLAALEGFSDVHAIATGGNLGYAAAINLAMQEIGAARSFLVLNPDLQVEPGAIRAMRHRMAISGAGVVVPLLKDDNGTVYPSLRREPTVTRAIGDAVMGSKLSGRPAWLSEMDFDNESYMHAHKVDWATGAALLIHRDVAQLVGDWDEDYFLYSEETDFMHRVRQAGWEIWFESQAVMSHSRGGSGTSLALNALMAINRIKYIRKFHTRPYSRAFRSAVILSALLRVPVTPGIGVLAAVLREGSWGELPHAEIYPEGVRVPAAIPTGTVIIPAHNEASVLRRTLDGLVPAMVGGTVEVIVACNGCTDDTASIARSYKDARVIEVEEASKTAALNAGDQVATRWPRMYLDADIELPLEALCATLELLGEGGAILCARPAYRYDFSGASWPVRAFYRARNRLPKPAESIWGAGVYAISRKGKARLPEFPSVAADDCLVDRLYSDKEKAVVQCAPATVRTPRTTGSLLKTLGRNYRSNVILRDVPGSHTMQTLRDLVGSVSGPRSAVEAGVYAAFALAGRLHARRWVGLESAAWESDESSRL